MVADLVATLGLDDDEFDRSLKRAEGSASRAFGRVGQVIEKRTEGLRKFSGALSSTVGIATGVLGAFTAIAGIVGTVVSLQAKWRAEQQRISKSVAEIHQGYAAIASISDGLSRQDNPLQRFADARAELQRQERETYLAFFQDAESERERDALRERLAIIRQELREVAALEDAERQRLAVERERDALRKRGEFIRSQSEERARLEVERQALREIQRLEAERLRIAERRARFEEQSLDVQILRAQGNDEAADALQRRLDLARRIAAIEQRTDISDAQKTRLIDKARELFRAQQAASARAAATAAAGATTTATPAQRQFRTLAAGLGAGVASQALAPGIDSAEERLLAATASNTSDTVEVLNEISDRLGDQQARFN